MKKRLIATLFIILIIAVILTSTKSNEKDYIDQNSIDNLDSNFVSENYSMDQKNIVFKIGITREYIDLEDKEIVRKAIQTAVKANIKVFTKDLDKEVDSVIPREIFFSIPNDFKPYNLNVEAKELWKNAKDLNNFNELNIYIYIPGIIDKFNDIATNLKSTLEKELVGLKLNIISQNSSGKLVDNIDSVNLELRATVPAYLQAENYFSELIDYSEEILKNTDFKFSKEEYVDKINKFDKYLLTESYKYIPLFEPQKILFNANVVNFVYNPRGEASLGYSFFNVRNLKLKNDSILKMHLNSLTDKIDFDISKTISDAQAALLNMLYEGLVNIVDGYPSEGIAKEWYISENGLTYTFVLKEDMKWSTGETVTAKDYYDSWIRDLKDNYTKIYLFKEMGILNIDNFIDGKSSINEIGIRLIDEYTLEIKLESPNYELLYELDNAYLYANNDTKFNGPFIFTEDVNNIITLSKNENYWNSDAIMIDKIKIDYRRLSDEELYLLYKNGDLDFLILSNVDRIIDDKYTLINSYVMYYLDFKN